MLFNIKKMLSTKEIIFNSFGQIFIKPNLIFNFTLKCFRFVSNK